MEIKKIHLEYAFKNRSDSVSCNGLRHVKTLPYLSVVQATEGHYSIGLGNGPLESTQCGGFFIAPSHVQQTILHNTDPVSKVMSFRWVFLKIKINDRYDFDTLYDLPTIVPESYNIKLHPLFERLFHAAAPFEEYVCYYEIVNLLSQLAQKKSQQNPPVIDLALDFINEAYPNKISVKDIADHVNFSESYLYAAFQKQLGVSPITYLNHYRLSLAADQLLGTDRSVTEIAAAVGIHDPVYFNKLFRKAYQLSPTKYREFYTKNSK